MYKDIFCCQTMFEKSQLSCRHHKGCPDQIILYTIIGTENEREISCRIIGRDIFGGSAIEETKIAYCPWCGTNFEALSGPVIGFHLSKLTTIEEKTWLHKSSIFESDHPRKYRCQNCDASFFVDSGMVPSTDLCLNCFYTGQSPS